MTEAPKIRYVKYAAKTRRNSEAYWVYVDGGAVGWVQKSRENYGWGRRYTYWHAMLPDSRRGTPDEWLMTSSLSRKEAGEWLAQNYERDAYGVVRAREQS